MAHYDIDPAHPGHRRIGCLLLIRNAAGDVLLVQPSYKKGLQLVGGGALPDEEPQHAAYREAVEETGISDLVVGDLLLVDYIPANPETGAVEGLNLVFDGGVVTDDTPIRLPAALPGQDPELVGSAFCPAADLDQKCRPYQARRIREALAALDDPARRGLCIEGLPA
jgi:8-oxo-dGTP pyrophosphatase MutT (NUDIX family)